MPGKSNKTKVTGVRLPIAIRETAQKRADKMGITLSDYCSRILVLQIGRKHGKEKVVAGQGVEPCSAPYESADLPLVLPTPTE